MKKRPGFNLREVCGERILVATGMKNIDFSKLIAFNETSAFIWKSMPDDTDFTVEELVEKLTDEYDVTKEQAQEDVTSFVKQLFENNVLDC